MRIVLFYSEVESFNYFSDVLAAQLQARGHEAFIFDLTNPGSGGFIPLIILFLLYRKRWIWLSVLTD